jgi:hypothetical protein
MRFGHRNDHPEVPTTLPSRGGTERMRWRNSAGGHETAKGDPDDRRSVLDHLQREGWFPLVIYHLRPHGKERSMSDFVRDHWMAFALVHSIGATLFLMSLGCLLVAVSVWKPETAYAQLLRLRKLFIRP